MLRKFLLSTITFLVYIIPIYAGDTNPVTLTPDDSEGDGNNGGEVHLGKGHRMPPAPVMCLIDFEEGTISGDSPVLASVSDYQLWDADGSVCITASPLAADVLSYAAASPGETFILRLVTPSLTLRGYISAD